MDIFNSFAQRRNVHRKHVETIIEVSTEVAFVHVGGKIAIGRRQDAHVDSNRFCASESLEFALLKYPKHCNLRFGRQVTDLVEE
jgi:hypothetical protein